MYSQSDISFLSSGFSLLSTNDSIQSTSAFSFLNVFDTSGAYPLRASSNILFICFTSPNIIYSHPGRERDHDHDRDPDRERDHDPDHDPDRERDHDPDHDPDRDPEPVKFVVIIFDPLEVRVSTGRNRSLYQDLYSTHQQARPHSVFHIL